MRTKKTTRAPVLLEIVDEHNTLLACITEETCLKERLIHRQVASLVCDEQDHMLLSVTPDGSISVPVREALPAHTSRETLLEAALARLSLDILSDSAISGTSADRGNSGQAEKTKTEKRKELDEDERKQEKAKEKEKEKEKKKTEKDTANGQELPLSAPFNTRRLATLAPAESGRPCFTTLFVTYLSHSYLQQLVRYSDSLILADHAERVGLLQNPDLIIDPLLLWISEQKFGERWFSSPKRSGTRRDSA